MPNVDSWLTYRTVVLDEGARSFVDAHVSPDNRLEDQWRGVEWLISRTPEVGVPKDSKFPSKEVLHVVAGSLISATKEIWLLYSYDDGEVIIHAARFADDE